MTDVKETGISTFNWQRIKLWFYRTCQTYTKGYVVYLILLVCVYAMTSTYSQTPIYPLSYYTLGWVLALFFPVVAVSFILASINVRYHEIVDRFAMDRLWMVYYPIADEETEYRFAKFLWKRVGDYYNLLEFSIFSLVAGCVTLLMYLLITAQFNIPAPDKDAETRVLAAWALAGPPWAVLAGSAFLGSLSGAIIFILRRYRMYDLRPMVFLQTTVALIAGTCSGAFITIIYPLPNLGALSFIIGFLSAMNIDFLPNFMRSQFAKLTGSQMPEEIKSDLSSIIKNTEAIESVNSLSIYSIRELANADPIRLYLNMPQQIEMINTMVDQALLHFYFPAHVEELGRRNIQRFTQLVVAMKPEFGDQSIRWPDRTAILDDGGRIDAMLLADVACILESRVHHRVLGLFLEKYRKAFFDIGTAKTQAHA